MKRREKWNEKHFIISYTNSIQFEKCAVFTFFKHHHNDQLFAGEYRAFRAHLHFA